RRRCPPAPASTQASNFSPTTANLTHTADGRCRKPNAQKTHAGRGRTTSPEPPANLQYSRSSACALRSIRVSRGRRHHRPNASATCATPTRPSDSCSRLADPSGAQSRDQISARGSSSQTQTPFPPHLSCTPEKRPRFHNAAKTDQRNTSRSLRSTTGPTRSTQSHHHQTTDARSRAQPHRRFPSEFHTSYSI